MTDQKIPLRIMTASQIWHDIEYGYTLSTKPYYEFVLLAEVEKVKEAEIQQLKDEHQKVMDNWKEYTNYQLRQKDGIIERLNETIHHQEDECIELEKQIETAKQNLIALLKSYGMEEKTAKRVTQRVFGEKTADNYNGDYDEYAERSFEENTET